MLAPEDTGTMYHLGRKLGIASKSRDDQDYAAAMNDTVEFLALAESNELSSLFFWLEEGIRNYAETTESTLKLLRETAEMVGYDHQGRYRSTFHIAPTQ